MQPERVIAELRGAPAIVRALVADLPPAEACVRPAPDAWSVRDVLCHLLDEERLDFAVRLAYTLQRPGEPWPPIDTLGWVTSHDYASADPAETLASWEAERARSLAWLAGLKAPDWEATYAAPWGPMRAGDLLASWAAHDTFHQRQIVRLRYRRLQTLAAPYSLRYAGDW